MNLQNFHLYNFMATFLKVQNHTLLHYNPNELKYLQILSLYVLHLLHVENRGSKELCIKF